MGQINKGKQGSWGARNKSGAKNQKKTTGNERLKESKNGRMYREKETAIRREMTVI